MIIIIKKKISSINLDFQRIGENQEGSKFSKTFCVKFCFLIFILFALSVNGKWSFCVRCSILHTNSSTNCIIISMVVYYYTHTGTNKILSMLCTLSPQLLCTKTQRNISCVLLDRRSRILHYDVCTALSLHGNIWYCNQPGVISNYQNTYTGPTVDSIFVPISPHKILITCTHEMYLQVPYTGKYIDVIASYCRLLSSHF